MKKVKPGLEALRVESFPTGGGDAAGTVHAHVTPGPGCGYSSWDSCNESCTCPIASVCESCDPPC